MGFFFDNIAEGVSLLFEVFHACTLYIINDIVDYLIYGAEHAFYLLKSQEKSRINLLTRKKINYKILCLDNHLSALF